MGGITGGKSRESMRQRSLTEQTSTQETSQQQRIDPASQQFVDQMRQQGLGALGMLQGHEGSFIAGPTDAFQQGLGTMGRIAGLDPDVQAQQVGAQQIDPSNLPGVQHEGMNFRAQQPTFGFDPSQMDTSRIQDFANPHEAAVVDAARADFDRQREGAMTAANQTATAEGAFGGSRSGILAAQALRDVNQDEAAMLSQLRSQGFGQALGAAQAEHGQMQQLGFGAAQARQQGDLAAQGMGLQAATTDAQLGLQAGMANQQQGMQAALANQQAALQAGLANQQAGLQAQGLNFQGLGLASQAGAQLGQMGEMERQVLQQQLQEPILRAQLGQQFLQGALGPVGQDMTGQTTGQQTAIQDIFGQNRGTSFGLSFGG